MLLLIQLSLLSRPRKVKITQTQFSTFPGQLSTKTSTKMEQKESVAEAAGMTELIHMVSCLQEVFQSTGVSLGLQLPRIAVVGGQSAGKSSVLENFVGKDFLPRGSGIVTRRPLVLQLHHSDEQEHATFLHTGDLTFAVGEEVRQEIVAETDRETGRNKGISRKPIHLRIYSPNVLDLTLVDLPGMTKVAVGDQPEDIELQIRGMILEYITEENTIILAVTPANQDLANSDALKLAREVDREGNRTIGVITKLDLMDKGTDARSVLENKVLPLKKGYIGVVNRSQRDINNKRSIMSAMSAEQEFFLTSPYKDMVPRLGTRYLQEVLHRELGSHIRTKVPEIRKHLVWKEKETEAALKELGYDMGKGEDKNLLFRLVNMFSERTNGLIDGVGREVQMDTVNQGAIINRRFYTDFYRIISNPFEDCSDVGQELVLAVANAHGVMNPLFVPEKAFQQVLQKMISRYEAPLTLCVALIRTELEQVVEESLEVVSRYPKLREELGRLAREQVIKGETATVAHLETHVKAQKAFINTRHPDFGAKKNPDVVVAEQVSETVDQPPAVFVVESTTVPDDSDKGAKYEKARKFKSPKFLAKFKKDRVRRDSWYSSNWSLMSEADAPANITESRSAPSSTPGSQPVSPKTPRAKLARSDTAAKSILGSSLIQEQANTLKRMVGDYMEITDTAIRDLAPKYIMLSLVSALQDYVREELLGDLLEEHSGPEAKQALVRRQESSKVPELLAARDALSQAMQVLGRVTQPKDASFEEYKL